jgi:hypothetical protein
VNHRTLLRRDRHARIDACRIDSHITRHQREIDRLSVDECCIDRNSEDAMIDSGCIEREGEPCHADERCIERRTSRVAVDVALIEWDRDCLSVDAGFIDAQSTRRLHENVEHGIDEGDVTSSAFTSFMMCGLNDRETVASCLHVR